MSKRTFIRDLTVGDRFRLSTLPTLMEVVGIGTVGNLTRVTYVVPSLDDGEWSFTKVNLTTVEVEGR